MKRTKVLASALAFLLLLSGCGGSNEPTSSSGMAMDKGEAMWGPAEAPAAPESGEGLNFSMSDSSTPRGDTAGSVYQREDAKLIRRCNIEMQTTEFDNTINALYDLVELQGGYFENSSIYGGSYYNANARRNGEYLVRIPAEKYSAFRTAVGELGYVTFSNESTEDIGEQYYDTEARLKTLRTKQERLQKLLEKADTMEDIITLESALGDVEYQIESYSSTLNRYNGLVNFATFSININEVVRVEEKTGEADSLWTRMGAGFRSGLEYLQDNAEDTLVWISYNFVGLIFILAAGSAVVIFIRRKKFKFPVRKRKNNVPKNGE